MGEKIMSPGEQFAFIFSILITLGTILILVSLFVSTRPIVQTDSLIRTNAEIADNIFTSNLVVPRAVFVAKELDGRRGSKLEEPVRHCGVGYFMQVKTRDEEWSFGYQPEIFTDGLTVSQSYPAAVSKNGIQPARVTLTVYDNLFTRVSCMAEKAYKLGEIQKMEIPCLSLSTEIGEPSAIADCTFAVYKKQKNNQQFICTSRKDRLLRQLQEPECRYLPDVIFDDVFLRYRTADSKTVALKAYPVRTQTPCQALKINPGLIAKKGEVQSVVFCIE